MSKKEEQNAVAIREENAILVKSDNPFINKFQTKAVSVMNSYFNEDAKIRKFVGAMQICFKKNPALKKCTDDSLFDAFISCVESGLYPGAGCHIIPYGDTATFQLDYRGDITIACRGSVADIDAFIVYQQEVDTNNFEYQEGISPILIHKPDPFSLDRGEPVGAYAIAKLKDGSRKFRVMGKEQILKHREFSQSYKRDCKKGTKYSPWQPENDPQLTMWLKTVIRQLVKMLPLEVEDQRAMQMALEANRRGEILRGEYVDINNDMPQIEDTSKYASQEDIVGVYKMAENEGWGAKDIDAAMECITGMKPVDTARITEEHINAFKIAIYQGLPTGKESK